MKPLNRADRLKVKSSSKCKHDSSQKEEEFKIFCLKRGDGGENEGKGFQRKETNFVER